MYSALVAPPAQGGAAPQPAIPAVAAARPSGAFNGDLELGQMVAAQAMAPLPRLASGADTPLVGGGVAAAAAPESVPADVAAERQRVRAQFDAAGQPRPDMEVDPISILALSKTYPLAEPLVLPPTPLNPLQISQLQAAGINPAVAAGAPTIVREKRAIVDLHLGVRRGECLGLLGPNGAGKSSTAAVLCGTLLPDSGNAFFHGRSCVGAAASPSFVPVSHRLGFVPQAQGLFDALTAWQHVLLYGRLKGLPDRVIQARGRAFFDALQLTPHTHQLAEYLSGGSKRKLLLCIALIGSPSCVILDEMSTGVDVSSRQAMWSLLRQSMHLGGTSTGAGGRGGVGGSAPACILTTHSMEEAEALATRLTIMTNGQMRCIGRASALKKAHGGGLELQVKLRPPAHAASGDAAGGPLQLRERYLPMFERFVCALVDAVRRGSLAQAQQLHSPPDDEEEQKSSSASGAFDVARLAPLSGFPFEQVPATLPPAASAARTPSARLLSHYNGLLTFQLSPHAASAAGAAGSVSATPPFSLALFFGYMQRYRDAYGIDDFALQQATLDHVFIKFAREQIPVD